MKLYLKYIEIAIFFNDYPEIIQEIGEIAKVYKKQFNEEVYIEKLPIPIVHIKKVKRNEGIEIDIIIDTKRFLFRHYIGETIVAEIKDFTKEKELLTNIIKKDFVTFWDIFNKIANRKIIEKTGFIIAFETDRENLTYLKNRIFQKSKFNLFTLRLFEFEESKYFKYEKIARNIIIEPVINAKQELEVIRIVNDIATGINSSTGVIELQNLNNGIIEMLELSIKNLKEFEEMTNGV